MRHALRIILLSLCSSVCASGQGPGALPESLRSHVAADQFGIVTSMRGLPLGVRDAMGELIRGQYTDFAEPGTPFRATAPMRRLVMAACSTDHHCIVYYERGGTAHTWHVAMFQWTPAATRFEWGGAAPGGLKTLDELRTVMLSGAVKSSTSSW